MWIKEGTHPTIKVGLMSGILFLYHHRVQTEIKSSSKSSVAASLRIVHLKFALCCM